MRFYVPVRCFLVLQQIIQHNVPDWGCQLKSSNLMFQLVEMFNTGFGCHHAGMLRAHKNLVEKIFAQRYIKVTKTYMLAKY
jgi:superfamily II RNA helicase